MMVYMRPYLREIKGVHEVFPTQQTSVSGRWNVIVDKALFQATRIAIQQSLPTLLTKVHAEAIPPAGTFADLPTIPNLNKGSIDNSFLTTSAQSFLSIDTTSFAPTTKEKPRTVYGSKSWSEIARPTTAQPPPEKPTINPPGNSNATTVSDKKIFEQLDAQKQELRAMQDQIAKLEKSILLLTKKLESNQQTEPPNKTFPTQLHKPQLQQPHHNSRPRESETMDKAKRASSEIKHTPPKTPSKRQRAHTASPREPDEGHRMDVSSDSQHQPHEESTVATSTNQSAKMLKLFFDRYRAVAAD